MTEQPKHIALIMDGNGRWAHARGLPRRQGHEHGVEAAARAVQACAERSVKHLTLFAFSHSNWKRPKDEVELLMRLCMQFADDHRQEWVRRSIRLEVIGALDELPRATRLSIERAIAETRGGERMVLTLALGYAGRHDLVGAVRAIAARAQAGLLLPEEIDEQRLRAFMTTGNMPDPDLVIRTGGEKRLSDFLLFECANAELFFADEMWPDFDDALLERALAAFSRRQRRFGRTAEQLAQGA
ncbi:MAG: di-trans,poly-cis-decaprenylcistransferase [Myxococcales bacterium]|nr:di-trans,poly-cis-decaprenylcistransferase [Myxococcales bacterium]